MNKMKVEGDLGAARHNAAAGFFRRTVKNDGKGNVAALPYRKPKIEGGSGPRAV